MPGGTWRDVAWDVADYLPSACSMQDLLEYVSCLSGTQNVKKPVKPFTGCLVIDNILYSQKSYISSYWVIFIIHMSLAVGRGGGNHLRHRD